eukprot:352930-Chlamydomonas_euryale.AAC.3
MSTTAVFKEGKESAARAGIRNRILPWERPCREGLRAASLSCQGASAAVPPPGRGVCQNWRARAGRSKRGDETEEEARREAKRVGKQERSRRRVEEGEGKVKQERQRGTGTRREGNVCVK